MVLECVLGGGARVYLLTALGGLNVNYFLMSDKG